MPSLTQIKRRKLLPSHQIQQLEDNITDVIRGGELDGLPEGGGLLTICGGKMDDGSDWCMIVTITAKEIARIKKTMLNS